MTTSAVKPDSFVTRRHKNVQFHPDGKCSYDDVTHVTAGVRDRMSRASRVNSHKRHRKKDTTQTPHTSWMHDNDNQRPAAAPGKTSHVQNEPGDESIRERNACDQGRAENVLAMAPADTGHYCSRNNRNLWGDAVLSRFAFIPY